MRAVSASRQRGVVNWLRSQLSTSARRHVRALTDPLAGPLGSIRAVRTNAPLLTLTFDDGPDPQYTPGILDALSLSGMQATWFVLVDRAESNPGLVKRMIAEGHDVGLHGLDHRRLTRLSYAELLSHIEAGANRLERITGRPPRFFRPPYGSQNLASFVAVRRHGMQSVVWSADCDDWSQHPEIDIARRATDAAAPGAVLLMHDSLAADPLDPAPRPNLDRAAMVEFVVQGLISKGMKSVSLSKLLSHGPAHRTMWFRG